MMKASKFSDAQKAFILKQGDDGLPVADICRKAGISQAKAGNQSNWHCFTKKGPGLPFWTPAAACARESGCRSDDYRILFPTHPLVSRP